MSDSPAARITFGYSPPPPSLGLADPPHPGWVIGNWSDRFVVVFPSGSEILDDPFIRSELVERFEQLRAQAEETGGGPVGCGKEIRMTEVERLRAALRHIADSYEAERESAYVPYGGKMVELADYIEGVLGEPK